MTIPYWVLEPSPNLQITGLSLHKTLVEFSTKDELKLKMNKDRSTELFRILFFTVAEMGFCRVTSLLTNKHCKACVT